MNDTRFIQKCKVRNVIDTVKLWGIHLGKGIEWDSAYLNGRQEAGGEAIIGIPTSPPKDMTISAVSWSS